MDPVTIALGLAQLAPSLIKWFGGSDKSVAVAEKAIDVAKAVTGQSSGEEALKELQVNPELVIAYRKAVLDQELAFQTLAVQNATDINKTMQAETTAEHWPSFSWRPFIGFQFGFYIMAQWLLPLFHVEAPKIDSELMLAIGSILGVASWFRGRAQADPSVVNSQQVTQKG